MNGYVVYAQHEDGTQKIYALAATFEEMKQLAGELEAALSAARQVASFEMPDIRYAEFRGGKVHADYSYRR